MVRDAYSAGAQPPHADDDDTVEPLDLRGDAANLTQELSLLLAQSIAQGQPGKRPPLAGGAGGEWANLAAGASPPRSRRTPHPSSGEALPPLPYTRPPRAPMPPPPPAPAPAPPAPSGLPPIGGGLGGGSMGGGL